MNCPDCGVPIAAVCGYHAPDAPTGYQPKSYGTPGEHYIQSHRCRDERAYVACATCGLLASALIDPDKPGWDMTATNAAAVEIGGYWR